MSWTVLPIMPTSRPPAPSLVASIRLGKHVTVSLHAFTAEEMGIPLVELRVPGGDVLHLTVEQAEHFAAGFAAAAKKAKA